MVWGMKARTGEDRQGWQGQRQGWKGQREGPLFKGAKGGGMRSGVTGGWVRGAWQVAIWLSVTQKFVHFTCKMGSENRAFNT